MNLTPEQKEGVLGFLARMKERVDVALELLSAEDVWVEDPTFEYGPCKSEWESDLRTIKLLEKIVGEK